MLGGVIPSVASHSMSWMPSVVSWNEPVRGFEPLWFSTVTGLPSSVQTRFVTPESSVAETLTVIPPPFAARSAALNQPSWPAGGAAGVVVTVTSGG